MSDRATPETDASRGYALSSHYGRLEGSYLQMDRSGPFVHAEVARKLERERNEAREDLEFRRGLYKVQEEYLETARRERDEARELLRILAGLVAYGLGQSGEEWSLEAMRQATTAIQNAKSLEGAK